MDSKSKSAEKKGSDRSKQLGIEHPKDKNFSEWYSEIITKAEMIEYYDISGCYILRPWSFLIWEQVKNFFDGEIKKLGVQNSYFPLFVSERALNQEASHVEGFAPEVAWVTRSGKSELKQPIAVRPTSETIMYPAYAKWIRSHRDLPLKLNQWSNVVRWEFKSPTPFLRSREFLWQEGHTAFATLDEASEEVLVILELYKRVYEEILAVPVVKGQKTEEEKFPGGLYTTTVECFIPTTGRGIQAATSHCLGQNFAKMFQIEFENSKAEKEYVWQNSWGITTRSVGIMTMVHGDDKGLVLPPRAAPYQFVLVPIHYKDKKNEDLDKKAQAITDSLLEAGFRGHFDNRENYKPGWKYNDWEVKGVPTRLDFGPADLEKNTIVIVRRDNFKKETVSLDNLVQRLGEIHDEIHESLFQKAKKVRDESIVKTDNWDGFMKAVDSKKMALVPCCDTMDCEDSIKKKSGGAHTPSNMDELKQQQQAQADRVRQLKAQKADKDTIKKEVQILLDLKSKVAEAEKTKTQEGEEEVQPLSGAAKSLCIPFDQPELPQDTKCFNCPEKLATKWILFGRSY